MLYTTDYTNKASNGVYRLGNNSIAEWKYISKGDREHHMENVIYENKIFENWFTNDKLL